MKKDIENKGKGLRVKGGRACVNVSLRGVSDSERRSNLQSVTPDLIRGLFAKGRLSAKEPKFLASVCIVLMLSVAISLFWLSAGFLTRAQDAPAAPPEPAPAAEEVGATGPSPCVKEMPEFISVSQKEFGEFINTHFRSPLPTSQLIPVAIERYAQLRDELRAKLAQYPPREGVSVGEADQQTSCKKLVDDGLTIPKMLLQQHIMTNAYAKKSTRLVDKYKEINSKLDKLNFTVAQMYGYFAALSQQIPCYAKVCKKQ